MAIENSAGDFGYGPSDAFINAQSEQGQKAYERQRYGRPRFQFPDISQEQVDRNRLLNVLMGASGGVQAASGAANPLAAIALGLGGGIQAGQASQAQQQAAQLAKTQQEQAAMLNEGKIAEDMLNQAPVGQVSPKIAEALKMKYGMDVADIPMGQFQKFAGLLQHSNDLERKMMEIQARARQAATGDLSPQALKMLSETSGIPVEELRGMKRQEVTALGLSPKPLTGEALKTYNNVSDGANDLRQAISLYDTLKPEQIKLASVQGVKGKAVRIMDEDAQRLNRLVANASDILARQRTGAAINMKEEEYYNGLLNSFYSSRGQNKEALVKFLGFYEQVQRELEAGQRGAGSQVIMRGRQRAQESQAKTYSQTATNPQTGQKIGLNAQGQWEVIK